MSVESRRTGALQRWSQLKTDRSSWVGHWRELAHFLLPRSGKFDESDPSTAGGKKHMHLLDTTGTRAVNILTAGLLSGASSPARPWFRLRTPDEALNKRDAVKRWLWEVEQRMREVFNHANTYRAFRQFYQEISVFGTAANILLPNFKNVIHNTPLTIGEYAIDTDDDGNVNAIYRRFELNVGQLVQRFGYANCSNHVRALYDRGSLSPWIPVLHVIEPRRERDPLKMDNKNMPYASCYYEFGANGEEILRESGHREFPGQVARWETRGANQYGDSPGMISLGYVKELQHKQLRKAQGIDFMTLPPLGAPPSAQAKGLNLAPGSISYVDVGTTGVKSLFDVRLELGALLEDIRDCRQNINSSLFVDLFMLFANDDREQPATAREISEKHEEKLLMLGPVLESLHDEFLGPYIELAFVYMLESGLVPPPPKELEGVPLSIQFVSMLAQAQRLVGLSSVERLIGSVINVAPVVPGVLDKLDFDHAIEVYGDMLGTDPTLIVADDKVALIRADRAKQQAVQQKMAMAQQGAGVAKDLGAAGPEGIDAGVRAAQQLGIS